MISSFSYLFTTDEELPIFTEKNVMKYLKKIFNPDFKCYCILDPIFQFYSQTFKEFISRSPEWVNTINATEGGSIFGDRIIPTKFSDFLKNYS